MLGRRPLPAICSSCWHLASNHEYQPQPLHLPPSCAGAPAGFLLPVNLSTWVFAGLTSAASLVAGGRPADLVAEMKEVAEGVKKKE